MKPEKNPQNTAEGDYSILINVQNRSVSEQNLTGTGGIIRNDTTGKVERKVLIIIELQQSLPTSKP
jgi:hypothetical protein